MATVGSEVLAFDVGVDRHLSDLASTNWFDEIDRHDATTLVEQALGTFGDFDLHAAGLPIVDDDVRVTRHLAVIFPHGSLIVPKLRYGRLL